MYEVIWFKPTGKPRTAKSWGRGRGGRGVNVTEQFHDPDVAVARWRELRASGFELFPIAGLPVEI